MPGSSRTCVDVANAGGTMAGIMLLREGAAAGADARAVRFPMLPVTRKSLPGLDGATGHRL
ncbi:hypothetical protein GCM10025774_06290 [Microbacterium kyungheense]